MNPKPLYRPLAVALTLALLALACGRSPSPRFYTLSPVTDQFASGRTAAGQNAAVLIGPVKLAEYLDRAPIVTRTGDNQLTRDDFNRWGGSLRDNFTNVLADNIGALLPSQQIFIFPWRTAAAPDFQVLVDVVRFDGRLGDSATLEARWTLLQGPERQSVKTSRASITEPVAGPDYADLVAAQSRAVSRLSQEIVQAIRSARPF